MSNRYALPVVVLGVAAMLALLYYFYQPGKSKFDWNDAWNKAAYSEKNDEPYGTRIFYRLLDQYFPGKKLHLIDKDPANQLPAGDAAISSYVFIGGGMYLDSLDTQKLLDYVAKGNTALIISKSIPFDLMTLVYYEECEYESWDDYEMAEDSLALFHFFDEKRDKPKGFALHYAKQNKPSGYQWNYIDKRFFCETNAQMPLGYLNDSLINFAWFPHGEGQFLFHTNPVAFSNYNLLRPDARAYAEGVLSYLPEGDIYWDGISRVPEMVSRKRNRSASRLPEEHPLTFLLQQPALAWAWYLLFGLSALYLVFRAKRRQRIIPVLPKNENSSYEFISTIANLHFRQKDYRSMCVQSMKIFLAQLRDRYGITAQLQPDLRARIDDAFTERLARVTEVPEKQIKHIFTHYGNCIQYEPDEQMLIDLHLAIEAFEQKAK